MKALLLASLLALPLTAMAAAPDKGADSAYQPAPMPNQELFAPVQRADPNAQLSPSVFNSTKQYRGDGYSFGSSSQSYEYRKSQPGYGVSFKMPLQ